MIVFTTKKSALLLLLFFSFFYFAVNAQTDHFVNGGNLTILNTTPIGAQMAKPNGVAVVDPTAIYSNVTTFLGQALANGGEANSPAITRMIVDSLGYTGGPYNIDGFVFSMANLNSVAVSARPLVRFYEANGVGNGPGTFITGFNFNPVSVASNSVILLNANVPFFTIPAGAVWAGILFDNSGATANGNQLNSFGQGVYGPIDLGSSTDSYFRTTAAPPSGLSFASNNPGPGTTGNNFAGTPLANCGWELRQAPTINSIVRNDVNPQTAANVISWNASFSQAITGLTTSNFALALSGVTAGLTNVTEITPTLWRITATVTAGTGTVGLDMVNATNLNTSFSNTLPFVGEVYTINGVLPLKWISFIGKSNTQKQAQLVWQVSENNVATYQIEKSNNGQSFDNGASSLIPSKGNGTNTYRGLEALNLQGNTFYRIKQTDNDGRFSFSPIVKITNGETDNLVVSPNPNNGNFTILGGNSFDFLPAQLLNPQGQIVWKGDAKKVINTVLAPGIYFLQVNKNGEKIIQKVIIHQ